MSLLIEKTLIIIAIGILVFDLSGQIYQLDLEETKKITMAIDSISHNDKKRKALDLEYAFKDLELFLVFEGDSIDFISGGKNALLTKGLKSKSFPDLDIDKKAQFISDGDLTYRLTNYGKNDSKIQEIYRQIKENENIKKKEQLIKDSLLVFSNLSINYDTIVEGDTIIQFFKFQNKSDQTISIKNIDWLCRCTSAEWPSYPINPGAIDSIKTYFHSKDRSEGKNTKTFSVFHSLHDKPVRLKLEGYIKNDNRSSKDHINDNPYEIFIDTLNEEELKMAILDFESYMIKVEEALNKWDTLDNSKSTKYTDVFIIDTLENNQYLIWKDIRN